MMPAIVRCDGVSLRHNQRSRATQIRLMVTMARPRAGELTEFFKLAQRRLFATDRSFLIVRDSHFGVVILFAYSQVPAGR
jgi:hypothetical protein